MIGSWEVLDCEEVEGTPTETLIGEAIDFWRVEEVHFEKLLRPRAEMKLPGRAWLQWEITPVMNRNESILIQTASFAPTGLGDLLYWYSLYPIHSLIFSDMANAIAEEAASEEKVQKLD